MRQKDYAYILLAVIMFGVVTGAVLFEFEVLRGSQEGISTQGGDGVINVSNPSSGGVVPDGDAGVDRSNLSIGEDWFVERSAQKGLRLRRPNTSDAAATVEHEEGRFGNGVYTVDYNKDYRTDVLALVGYRPVLFENIGEEFEVDEDALAEIDGVTNSALFFDYDNDGYEDLYLLSDEDSVFLRNDEGVFRREDVGLPEEYGSVRGATAADYTGNGCLDLFVFQSNDWLRQRPEGYETKEVPVDEDNGYPNRLFAGDCNGFDEVTEAGIGVGTWSLAASFVDFTDDGLPDIHVANDFNNDIFYTNEGDGGFDRRVLSEATNRNGMSSEVADVNGDGMFDIFVSNIHSNGTTNNHRSFAGRVRGNNLLVNEGGGNFTDKAEEYGVKESAWGWAALLEDFDNDGEVDLYQATSLKRDKFFYFWKGGNRSFSRVEGSFATEPRWTGTGVVSLDYNSDGSMDMLEAAFLEDIYDLHLYENKRSGGNWLKITVGGDGSHTTIGTEVEVSTEGSDFIRVNNVGSDYFSQDTRVLHYGLGNATRPVDIRAAFPDGTRREYRGVEPNRHYVLSPTGIEPVERR